MAQIVAYDDVKANRKQIETPRGPAWNTQFLAPPEGTVEGPHAFLAEGTRTVGPHYHHLDEFQVVVNGGGMLGKHRVGANTVHFARAYTPYGPIVPDVDGLGFLTLRLARDLGRARHLPANRDKLLSIPQRRPWQASELPAFDGAGDVCIHKLPRFQDEGGLAAFALSLKPGARTAAPDPSTSDGQYIVITNGELHTQGTIRKAITIIFVKPDEQPFQLVAGAPGMQALVLNFPRPADAA